MSTNVGLTIGTATPSARPSPCVKVVLPLPRSPDSQSTSPACSSGAMRAASACVPATSRVRAAHVAVTLLIIPHRPGFDGLSPQPRPTGAGPRPEPDALPRTDGVEGLGFDRFACADL